MLRLRSKVLAGLGLASMAHAVTPISPAKMTDLLNAGGVELAISAQPMFFFGQAMNQPPCIPTFAYDSNNRQTPAAALCDYPNVGCNCRTPGVPIVSVAPSFPVYYTYQQCNATEIRVAYNLFYEKDGVNPQGLFGHAFDWERVIVIWALKGNGNWSQDSILLSQHSGYQKISWDDIQNTFNTEDADLLRGGQKARLNLDHPMIYIAWFKHSHYDDRDTGWNDILSQLDDNAFRSEDWWYFPTAEDYIRCDDSTECGALTVSMDWGDASSNPPSVHKTLCQAS